MDYKNGKIYKLINYVNNDIYIGSTSSTLVKRKASHKGHSKYKPDRRVYQCLNKVGWDFVDIVLIEKFPCVDKIELHQRERYWIEKLLPSLNCQIPGRTVEEWTVDNRDEIKEKKRLYHMANREKGNENSRLYRMSNRDKIKETYRLYYNANLEKINEKAKVKITCECGRTVSKRNISTHRKSAIHIKLMSV